MHIINLLVEPLLISLLKLIAQVQQTLHLQKSRPYVSTINRYLKKFQMINRNWKTLSYVNQYIELK